MNVLELYSGIGGMHMAFSDSKIQGRIVAAVEISTVANEVYKHNFPETLLLNRNVQWLSPKFLNDLQIDTILMSPPCQPFTRNGLKKDTHDTRTLSFFHILYILPQLNVKYILIENVKGFETSAMRNKLIEALEKSNFTYQEFILSPNQIGISNTRHRYYCLAKKSPLKFPFETGPLKEDFPNPNKTDQKNELFEISTILETNVDFHEYRLPEKLLLKRAKLLDICTPICKRSCCFTKAYGKYVEGTGSVFTPKTKEEIDKIYKNLEELEDDDYIECIKQLELRFFTPKEICRLMGFPEFFVFPKDLTINQRYKLLGNSINVKIVSKLINILFEN